jgi:hypothetical protein
VKKALSGADEGFEPRAAAREERAKVSSAVAREANPSKIGASGDEPRVAGVFFRLGTERSSARGEPLFKSELTKKFESRAHPSNRIRRKAGGLEQ